MPADEVLERLARIEEKLEGKSVTLLRTAEALELFRGTKEQFYRFVANGEIETINYGDDKSGAHNLYDRDQILEVIERHRMRAGKKVRS